MRSSFLITWALLGLVVAGCSKGSGPRPKIESGGSTFVYPMISRWAGEYYDTRGVEVRYLSAGSGKGIEGMINKQFDFGCTDAPLNDAELARAREAGGEVVHIPLVLGAVGPAYNLPGVDKPLRFTGPVLADIFLGKIERWDDPALKHLNPGVDLPNRKMIVVHRLDSSGTTYVFTEYLSAISPEWKKRVGKGKVVEWPAGIADNGNGGVAGTVSRTAGAIAYLEQKASLLDNLKLGLVENNEGTFVSPTTTSVAAAFNNTRSRIPDDLRFSIINPLGKESYPICSAVWAVLYVKPSGERAGRAVEFLKWVLDEGQALAEEMSYAPLPAELLQRARKQLARVHVDDGPS